MNAVLDLGLHAEYAEKHTIESGVLAGGREYPLEDYRETNVRQANGDLIDKLKYFDEQVTKTMQKKKQEKNAQKDATKKRAPWRNRPSRARPWTRRWATASGPAPTSRKAWRPSARDDARSIRRGKRGLAHRLRYEA